MTTKMIASIALALVLGALPAGAGLRDHETADDATEALAYRLKSAAGELYRDAARHARQLRSSERSALRALQHFDLRADRFLERVVRDGLRHPRTRHAFEQLEQAFATAGARLADLRHARRLNDEFERVESLMYKLDRRLAIRSDDVHPRRHAAVRTEHRQSCVSFRLPF